MLIDQRFSIESELRGHYSHQKTLNFMNTTRLHWIEHKALQQFAGESVEELVDFVHVGWGEEEVPHQFVQVPVTDNLRVSPEVDHEIHQHIVAQQDVSLHEEHPNADNPTCTSSTAHNHRLTYEPLRYVHFPHDAGDQHPGVPTLPFTTVVF